MKKLFKIENKPNHSILIEVFPDKNIVSLIGYYKIKNHQPVAIKTKEVSMDLDCDEVLLAVSELILEMTPIIETYIDVSNYFLKFKDITHKVEIIEDEFDRTFD